MNRAFLVVWAAFAIAHPGASTPQQQPPSSRSGVVAARTAADVVRELLQAGDTAATVPIAVATNSTPSATAVSSGDGVSVEVLISAEIDRGRMEAAHHSSARQPPEAGRTPPADVPSAERAAPTGQALPGAAAAAAPRLPPASNVDELVRRATGWLTEYAKQLSLVIGVEHYSQYMGSEGFARAYKKQLVSEFALVRVKDDWLGFRDVYEVDGKRVLDREDRLRKLLLDDAGSAMAQARQITNESARHNLGAIQRNFNVPTMALFFLYPPNTDRFRFRKDGEETIDGHRAWKVRYEESRKPTIIQTASGKDMPVKGTFWIDASAGTVLKTHMELSVEARIGGDAVKRGFDGGSVVRVVHSSASVTVTFKENPKLGLLLPDTMLETYEGPAVNRFTGDEEISRVNCHASYSDFRRFETSGRVLVPR